MTTFGLGVDDASHALIVSRAVQRAMKERGLSAVEAIDDLSSKLNITKLVTCGGGAQELVWEQPLVSSRPSSPQLQRANPTPPTSLNTDRMSSSTQQRKARKGSAKTGHNKNGKQKAMKGSSSAKNQSRKRPTPDDKFTGRERSDSMTEAVEAKAKKARLSPEDATSAAQEADSAIVVRTKRNIATTVREDAVQANTV